MFPVISGQRERTRRVGLVADFCERCLSITRHQVIAHLIATHIYYIPIHQQEVDRVALCQVCGSRSLHAPRYQRCLGRAGARFDIRQLLMDTNPGLVNATDSMLDLWEQLETPAARDAYVARQFLATQESTIERHLAQKPLAAFAATALATAGTMFFWWGGNVITAFSVAPLIVLAPASVIRWQHGRIARLVQVRFQRLLSGTATHRETLDQVLSTQSARYPHTAQLWRSLRTQLSAAASNDRRSPPNSASAEYLALAAILPES